MRRASGSAATDAVRVGVRKAPIALSMSPRARAPVSRRGPIKQCVERTMTVPRNHWCARFVAGKGGRGKPDYLRHFWCSPVPLHSLSVHGKLGDFPGEASATETRNEG